MSQDELISLSNGLQVNIKKFKWKRDYIYIIIILLILGFLMVREWVNQGQKNQLVNNISNYSDSAKSYRLANGKLVAYNTILQLENDKQIKSIIGKDADMNELMKKFKSISNAVITKQTTTIIRDTVNIPVNIPCITKPIPLTSQKPYYFFKGTLTNNKLLIDSLCIPNTQKIIIGQKKTGLFKTEQRIEILNTNPYVKIENVGEYSVVVKKKWYQTQGFALAVGVVGGYLLIKK